MARTRRVEECLDPEPSAGVLDSYMRLAAAVVVQALSDSRDRWAVEKSLGAILWLLDDGVIYLNALGFDCDDISVLQKIGGIANGQNIFGSRKPTAYSKRSNSGNEQPTIGQV